MASFVRQHTGAVTLSVLLHLGVVAALSFGLDFRPRRAPRVAQQLAIEASVVDQALVQREMDRIDALEREEVARREEDERLAREAAEAEQRQLDEVRQAREEAERVEAERQTQLQRERERLAEAERQREAEEARQREAERLRQEEEARLARERAEAERRRLQAEAEARRQAELDAELQLAIDAENERQQAEDAGLLDQYVRMIENRIQQSWIRPASARPGLECVVNVQQIPSGDVVDVRIGRCNGDEAVVRSIEAAVLRASPLPRPPVQSLFARNLEVIFRPDL